MRRPVVLAATLLLAAGVGVPAEPAGASAHRYPATQKSIIRPVNAAGFARAGYRVMPEPSGGVDCSFPDPSPGAVSPNIEFCSPSAAYAVACWKAAAAHKVLCMRDPRVRQLARIQRLGPFAPTGLAPASDRAPLSMVLGNGAYCTIRDGGAGPERAGHPRWVATYYCDNGGIVWMRPGARHQGVFEGAPSWTVIVAGTSGPIFARHALRAWFVGTFAG